MNRTRIVSSLALGCFVSFASLTGSLGCSASTAAGDPTAGATSAQTGTRVAAVAPAAKSSPVRMIADALSTVPLADDQRAQIEKLASEADARHAAAAGAHAEIMTALAAQVEAGQIDRLALQAKIDAAADAANVTRPADQASLQQLHALLTPEQRGQVADAIESRHKAMHAGHAGHGEHGEHGEHATKMEEWATELKLTDAQRAQIAAVFASQRAAHAGEAGEHRDHAADFRAMHASGKAKGFAESFRSETLTLPAPSDARAHANAMADHLVGIAQAVLPILTPEQRSLAAAKLRAHATVGAAGEDAPLGE